MSVSELGFVIEVIISNFFYYNGKFFLRVMVLLLFYWCECGFFFCFVFNVYIIYIIKRLKGIYYCFCGVNGDFRGVGVLVGFIFRKKDLIFVFFLLWFYWNFKSEVVVC